MSYIIIYSFSKSFTIKKKEPQQIIDKDTLVINISIPFCKDMTRITEVMRKKMYTHVIGLLFNLCNMCQT